MSTLGRRITKIRAKNIHTEAGMSLIEKGLPKSVKTEAVMSFRIKAQRKFYTKAVILLIQQALVAFWTAAGSSLVLLCSGIDKGRLCLKIFLPLSGGRTYHLAAGGTFVLPGMASAPAVTGRFVPIRRGFWGRWSRRFGVEDFARCSSRSR